MYSNYQAEKLFIFLKVYDVSASGLYSSNVIIFLPGENLAAPSVERFGGKIWGIFKGKRSIFKQF